MIVFEARMGMNGVAESLVLSDAPEDDDDDEVDECLPDLDPLLLGRGLTRATTEEPTEELPPAPPETPPGPAAPRACPEPALS